MSSLRNVRFQPRVESLEDRWLLSAALPPRFASSEEFRHYLRVTALARYEDLFGKTWDQVTAQRFFTLNYAADSPGNPLPAASPDAGFSRTNVQVAGVDEGDLVKNDGDFIYDLSGHELVIVKARPAAAAAIVSRTRLEGTPVAGYLDGDKFTVISSMIEYGDAPLQSSLVRFAPGLATARTKITVFDVSNRSAPRETKSWILDGNASDSRVVDDQLYVGLNSSFQGLPFPSYTVSGGTITYQTREAYLADITGHELELALPHYYVHTGTGGDDLEARGLVTDVTHLVKPPPGHDNSLLVLLRFNLASATADPAADIGILGQYSGTMYVSPENLYLVTPDLSTELVDDSTVWQVGLTSSQFAISTTGTIPGHLLNQFSLDEHDGYLRVATTIGTWSNPRNNIYVLEPAGNDLAVVGKLEGMAPGEVIRSVRFLGDRGYVVTFQQVDPLFALDLSVPTAPRLAGELHIPGFSSYLQPIDATHLLGIGRAGAPSNGLKFSLFDVADLTAPREIAQYVIQASNWNWWWGTSSEAEYNHHAVGWFPEYQTLAIPIHGSVANVIEGPILFDGAASLETPRFVSNLYVFQVDAATGIQVKGIIEHDSQVSRSLRIGETLYSVADDTIQARSITDPDQPGTELRIRDEPRALVLPTLTPVMGEAFTAQLVAFTVIDAAGLAATIDWGDGQTSPATLSAAGPGRMQVTGMHTYTEAGFRSITVRFTRDVVELDNVSNYAQVVDLDANHHQFLNRMYQDLLRRDVDPVGLVAWSRVLNHGGTRADIVAGIQGSHEFRTGMIHEAYQRFLGRRAEPYGVTVWLGFLGQGHSAEELQAQVVGSAEYSRRHGDTGDGFLRAVYRDVLQRDIDGTGRQAWAAALAAGRGRDAVAWDIAHSVEASRLTVKSMYTDLLERAPDDFGLSVFTGALRAERRLETFARRSSVRRSILAETDVGLATICVLSVYSGESKERTSFNPRERNRIMLLSWCRLRMSGVDPPRGQGCRLAWRGGRFRPCLEALEARQLLTTSSQALLPAVTPPLTEAAAVQVHVLDDDAFAGPVAILRAADPASLTSLIHWNDGSQSAGTVTAGGDYSFRVIGTAIYHESRSFTVTVDVRRAGEVALTVTTTILVHAELDGYSFESTSTPPPSGSGDPGPQPAPPEPDLPIPQSLPGAGLPWQRVPDSELKRPEIRMALASAPGPFAAGAIAVGAAAPTVNTQFMSFTETGVSASGSWRMVAGAVRVQTVRVPVSSFPLEVTVVDTAQTIVLTAEEPQHFLAGRAHIAFELPLDELLMPRTGVEDYFTRLHLLQQASQSQGMLTASDPGPVPGPSGELTSTISESPRSNWPLSLGVVWLLAPSLVAAAWCGREDVQAEMITLGRRSTNSGC